MCLEGKMWGTSQTAALRNATDLLGRHPQEVVDDLARPGPEHAVHHATADAAHDLAAFVAPQPIDNRNPHLDHGQLAEVARELLQAESTRQLGGALREPAFQCIRQEDRRALPSHRAWHFRHRRPRRCSIPKSAGWEVRHEAHERYLRDRRDELLEIAGSIGAVSPAKRGPLPLATRARSVACASAGKRSPTFSGALSEPLSERARRQAGRAAP